MKMKKILSLSVAMLLAVSLSSCGEIEHKDIDASYYQSDDAGSSSGTDPSAPQQEEPAKELVTPSQLEELFASFDCDLNVSSSFFEWCVETTDNALLLDELYDEMSANGYSDEKWYEITGMTIKATNDLYSGKAYEDNNIYVMKSNGEDGIQLTFGGDISLADNWHVMQFYETTENGITDCISPFLIDKMNCADIAMLNNEFCFSYNGEPMEGKAWTFRGKPTNVSIYHEMGIDIVDLANNHCYDFGKQAFLDTLDTLKDAGIEYMGAGRNIEEASLPVYYIIEGKKIAYVAATRAEKYILTPEATATDPGVLRCYDPAAFIEVIKEAKQNADIVIANVHWGTEDSHWLEDVQPETAYQYIDAGADLIVGSHAHCLQGIEYYKGVPIVYNLGNFWFSEYDIDTGLLGVTITDDNSMELVFYPATQRNSRTTYVGGEEEGARILQCMRDYSSGNNVSIDDNGVITEITQ